MDDVKCAVMIDGHDKHLSISYENYFFEHLNTGIRRVTVHNIASYTAFMSVLMSLYFRMGSVGLMMIALTLGFWLYMFMTDYKKAKRLIALRECICNRDYRWCISTVKTAYSKRNKPNSKWQHIVNTDSGVCTSVCDIKYFKVDDNCIVVELASGDKYCIPGLLSKADMKNRKDAISISEKSITADSSNMTCGMAKSDRFYDGKIIPDDCLAYLRQNVVDMSFDRLRSSLIVIAIGLAVASFLWAMAGSQLILLPLAIKGNYELLVKIAFVLRLICEIVIPVFIFKSGVYMYDSSYRRLRLFTESSTWSVGKLSQRNGRTVIVNSIKASILLHKDNISQFDNNSNWMVIKLRKNKIYAFCIDSFMT